MTIDDIERLVRRLRASDITRFEFADGATRLALRFAPAAGGPAAAVPEPAAPPAAGDAAVRAPAIGVLRFRHPAAADGPAPDVPRAVEAGEIVAFLEAGGCLRPVVVEAAGTIGAPLRADGDLVGYGTPLFPLL